jgi:serine/threonine protein kinase
VKNWKQTEEEVEVKIETPRAPEDDDEKFSSSIGTKLFSSPEQASSEKYDHRTDIYSLAIVIALLFNTYTTAHQQRDLLEKIRNRNLDNMAIPEALKSLLSRSLGAEH